MTIDTFLDALEGCATLQRFAWRTTEDMGFLHGVWEGDQHCPVSALAWCWGWKPDAHYREIGIDPCMLWDLAAEALGLSLEDASEIVSAADADMQHDPALRQALLVALGVPQVPEEDPPLVSCCGWCGEAPLTCPDCGAVHTGIDASLIA